MLSLKTPLLVPSGVSARINVTVAELAVTAMLLVCIISLWTIALGDPELMALVACIGIVVVLLSWAFLSAFNHRTDG